MKINSEKARAEMAARKQLDKETMEKTLGAKKVELERIAQGGANYALYNLIMTVHSFTHCGDALEFGREMYRMLYPNIKRLQNSALLMAHAIGEEGLKELGIEVETLDLDAMAVKELTKYQEETRLRAKMANKHNIYLEKAKDMGIYKG